MAYFLKVKTANQYIYDLLKCGEALVQTCARIKKGEHVTILTDVDATRSLPEVIQAASQKVGAETITVTMSSRSSPMEVPKTAKLALKDSNVVFACTSKSIWGTPEFRQEILDAGARMLAVTMFTEDMARRTIPIDYEKMRERCEKLSKILPETRTARVTSGSGTDLSFSLKGQKTFYWDGIVEAPHEFDVMPAGYMDVLPVPGSANGTAMLNGTWWSPKLGSDTIRTPIKLTVKDGWVAKIEGGAEAQEFVRNIEKADKNAKRFSEFALGLNPSAEAQSGFLMEDEKHAGLALIGMGGDTHLGGSFESNLHLDGTMLDATVQLDGKVVVENGVLKI